MTDFDAMTDVELEDEAQRAAEARLAYANALLFHDENPDEPLAEPLEGEEPFGPYDGCETCIVREVLHAAWPAMRELARRELDSAAMTGTPEANSVDDCERCGRTKPQGWILTLCPQCIAKGPARD
jgi:hypothetical protein